MNAPFAITLAALLTLSACLPVGQGDEDISGKIGPEAYALCRAEGGQVVQGLSGDICQRPTIDAGRACSAQSDCDGVCFAGSGQCSDVTPVLGCNRIMTRGGDIATNCFE
ncbi:MAG: hypothetical protein ACC631_09150 [Halocynthiibacter sp.]